MPRRSYTYYSSYSSYYGREKRRRVPNPLPYLVVALLALGGLAYFRFFSGNYETVAGIVTNSYTHAPMAGITVTLASGEAAPGTPVVTPTVLYTATTAADGSFLFDRVPANPMIEVGPEGFTPVKMAATSKEKLKVDLVPNVLRGTITDPGGKPIPGAVIVADGTLTRAGPGGAYTLKKIPADRRLIVKSSGYLSSTVTFGEVITQDVKLQPFYVKAIYVSADSVATPGKLQALLDLVDRTEINSVVIDVKAENSGLVLYDSHLPIVAEMRTADPIISDLDGLLAQLKQRNIYTIARLSLFWDQAATAARPDWALKSKNSPGQPWLDALGKRWANPHNAEVWNYNIAIAREVAERGFNEVQFDMAYFPSVGDLEDIDYGPDAVGRKRVSAIDYFLDHAYEQLSAVGAYVGVDVLGLTPYVTDDMGVGQHFEDIAARSDYICPFIYPSDFADGFLDYPKPAEHPADVVAQTVKSSLRRAAGGLARVRPWLQDFSGKVTYDAPKVRAELDAAQAGGAIGWMLWNFGNQYTEPALKGP